MFKTIGLEMLAKIRAGVLATVLVGLIVAACASAWIAAIRVNDNPASAMTYDDRCDSDWTRAGGAHRERGSC